MARQTHSRSSIGKALVILWAVFFFFSPDSLFALPRSDNCMRQSTEPEQVYLPQASRQVLMSCARRTQKHQTGMWMGRGIVDISLISNEWIMSGLEAGINIGSDPTVVIIRDRLIGQGIVMGTQRRARHVIHAFVCQSAWRVSMCKYVIL